MRPQWEGGWVRLEKGVVVVQVKAAAAFPKEKPPPPHLPFTPFHIFISLIHLSILLPPSPHHVFFFFHLSLSSALPHPHYRRLTQHMFSPLCGGALFYYRVKSPKSIYGAEVNLMTALLMCWCAWMFLIMFEWLFFTCAFCVFWDVGCIKGSLWKQLDLACVKAMMKAC